MKRPKTNTNPLTAVEWDTCWMAIRYAMNRQTIASASLPRELLSAYYDRWRERQTEAIIKDLRDNISAHTYFGNKNIDHPEWMRFLLTLDEHTHKIVTATNGQDIECIEFEGKYYPISGDRKWWKGVGELYVDPEQIKSARDKWIEL